MTSKAQANELIATIKDRVKNTTDSDELADCASMMQILHEQKEKLDENVAGLFQTLKQLGQVTDGDDFVKKYHVVTSDLSAEAIDVLGLENVEPYMGSDNSSVLFEKMTGTSLSD